MNYDIESISIGLANQRATLYEIERSGTFSMSLVKHGCGSPSCIIGHGTVANGEILGGSSGTALWFRWPAAWGDVVLMNKAAGYFNKFISIQHWPCFVDKEANAFYLSLFRRIIRYFERKLFIMEIEADKKAWQIPVGNEREELLEVLS